MDDLIPVLAPARASGDDGSPSRHTSPTLAELVVAHEARTPESGLELLDEPANESNALLRAELARLRAPTINRADDSFGLGL